MTEKLSKYETNYREAMGSQHCGNCSMFRPYQSSHSHRTSKGACTLVKGEIDAFDVCDKWEPNE